MTQSLIININDQQGTITGPLNRDTIATLDKHKHESMLKSSAGSSLTLDLAKITHVDTAGLAWLLLLLETAGKLNSHLSFAHIPDDLLKLAKLSAADTFLVN